MGERGKQIILHSCVLNEYLPSVHCLLDRLTTNGQASLRSQGLPVSSRNCVCACIWAI